MQFEFQMKDWKMKFDSLQKILNQVQSLNPAGPEDVKAALKAVRQSMQTGRPIDPTGIKTAGGSAVQESAIAKAAPRSDAAPADQSSKTETRTAPVTPETLASKNASSSPLTDVPMFADESAVDDDSDAENDAGRIKGDSMAMSGGLKSATAVRTASGSCER